MKDLEIDGGGQAFPVPPDGYATDGHTMSCIPASPGLTARQYAAIKLRVPDSGSPWLDEMIQKARRDAFAGEALAGALAYPGDAARGSAHNNASTDGIAGHVYALADAILAESEGGGA